MEDENMTYKTRHLDNPHMSKWAAFSTLNTDPTPPKNETNLPVGHRVEAPSVRGEDGQKNKTNPISRFSIENLSQRIENYKTNPILIFS
jgi:hypothetical protein